MADQQQGSDQQQQHANQQEGSDQQQQGTNQQQAAAPATCPILHLDLAPLDLNLLGLHVHLNEVVLDVEAIPGAGNLLGNLLCAVAGLLNGTDLSGILGNLLQNLLDSLIKLLQGLGGGATGTGGAAGAASGGGVAGATGGAVPGGLPTPPVAPA